MAGPAAGGNRRLPAADLPLALAEAHHDLGVGGRLELTLAAADDGVTRDPDRTVDATRWDPGHLRTVVDAAGFEVDRLAVDADPERDGARPLRLSATARLALPDHVGPRMRLLCCGLNPSIHAAEAGVGYVTGSNRFWRAMAAAGLAARDRDPVHLLRHDRIGMTDLVHRPTARAAELTTAEYRAGVARLEALCEWLRPAALAVVGLAGWRAAVDRSTTPGWRPEPLGPTPVYVLPSTSGLNAGTSLDDLVAHLLAAATGPV